MKPLHLLRTVRYTNNGILNCVIYLCTVVFFIRITKPPFRGSGWTNRYTGKSKRCNGNTKTVYRKSLSLYRLHQPKYRLAFSLYR